MKTTLISYQLIVSRGNFNLLKSTLSAKNDAAALEQAEEIAAFYTQRKTMAQLPKANKDRKKKLQERIEIVDKLFRVGDVTYTLTRFEMKGRKAKELVH